jgi:hypothetical protein
MASARSEPIATANRLSSFTFPPPPGFRSITLEADPHLGELAEVWGGPKVATSHLWSLR